MYTDAFFVEEVFEQKVFSTELKDSSGNNLDITEQFTFQWNLVDLNSQAITNGTANASQVQTVDNLAAENATIVQGGSAITNLYYKIPLNNAVRAGSPATTVSGLAAGAQGYKLQVVAKSTTN